MTTTEQRIIEATIKWIANNDYRDLSLRKLAQQIDMTTGALYKYFDSKEDLLFHASIALSQQIADQLAPDQSQSTRDQLLSIAKNLCKLCKKQPNVIDFLFFNPTLAQFYSHPTKQFAFYNTVMELSERVNPGILADQQFFNQIWSFIHGYSLLIIHHVARYDPRMVETTLDQLTRA